MGLDPTHDSAPGGSPRGRPGADLLEVDASRSCSNVGRSEGEEKREDGFGDEERDAEMASAWEQPAEEQAERAGSDSERKRGVKRKVSSGPADKGASSPGAAASAITSTLSVLPASARNSPTPIQDPAAQIQRPGPGPDETDTAVPNADVAIARMPARVPLSADRTGCGRECWAWADVPMNKQGFRYLPCAPSPHTSPAPLIMPFYRTIPAPPRASPVHLDWLDRSAYLKLADDAQSMTTEKGFRSARANVGVQQGAWYFEAVVENGMPRDALVAGGGGDGGGGGPHARVGWGRRESSINGPAGADGYSYALRDATGEKVHLSRPRAYGVPVRTGDVVGCLISLPPRREPDPADARDPAHVRRKRVAIRYKGQLYFETVDYTVCKEMEELVGRDLKAGQVPAGMAGAGEAGGSVAQDQAAGADADAAGPATTPSKIKTKRSGDAKHGKAVKRGRKLKPDASGHAADAAPTARHLPRLPGSSIAFFLNGRPMAPEPAFTDLFSYLPVRPVGDAGDAEAERAKSARRVYTAEAANKDRENPFDDGTLGYYPFFSVFGGGKVRFNPGPQWEAPVDDAQWGLGREDGDADGAWIRPRAMSERWAELRAEERVWDERDEADFVYKWEHGLREQHAADAAAREVKDASESGTPVPTSKPGKEGKAGRDGKSRAKARSSAPKKAPSKGTVSVLSGAHRRDSIGRRSTPDASSVRSSPAPSQGWRAGASSPAPQGRDDSVPPPNPRRSWAPSRAATPKDGSDSVPEDELARWDPDLLASLSRSELRQLKQEQAATRQAQRTARKRDAKRDGKRDALPIKSEEQVVALDAAVDLPAEVASQPLRDAVETPEAQDQDIEME